MEKRDILVLVDSRGAGLEDRIKKDMQTRHPNLQIKINVTVRTLGGACIDNILKRADERFPDTKHYDIIFVSVGVNNLTNKVPGGNVEPVFDNTPELVETLTDMFTQLKLNLKPRATKVVICQLVGIDFHRYNDFKDEGLWYYQQETLNKSMLVLAHTINFINRADNVTGPWLTGTVHDYVNHKQYNRYAKLKDGLHPRNELKSKWAKLFTDSFLKNV